MPSAVWKSQISFGLVNIPVRHGREHVVVIRPGRSGLIAHTMYFVNEVHADSESSTSSKTANPAELEMAKAFVLALAGAFEPEEFKDSYRESLENLIAAKTKRNEIARAAESSPKMPAPSPAINILEAPKKSLEARRPPAREGTAAQPKAVESARKRRCSA